MPETIQPVRAYVRVAVVLLVLTGLTIAVAHVNLGFLSTPVALLIAATKATLIGLVFMHLRGSHPLVRVCAIVGLVWLSILLLGTMDDFLTRDWLPIPGK
jgi:cytochrome c oxidase subunit 4